MYVTRDLHRSVDVQVETEITEIQLPDYVRNDHYGIGSSVNIAHLQLATLDTLDTFDTL
jgi:uncharacterized protein with von Willebrand factor type A (vWA) domain